LRRFFEARNVPAFSELALGMSHPAGNYSAAEHGLGPKILDSNPNARGQVYQLAGKFLPLTEANSVPTLIKDANIKWLKIGVGSELSCMMNPFVCWGCNRKTIWMYLARTQSVGTANDALQLFTERDRDSPMAYDSWEEAYHPELGPELMLVAQEGTSLAKGFGVVPRALIPYLWADAIASAAFDFYRPK